MYSRQLADRVVEFGHEGVLYRNSFIMYDRKTKSLWVHTTGECVKGELKGRQLEFIPSTVTSWRAWKSTHPKSLVLEGKKATGFMGTFSLKEKDAKKFGVSVGQGETTKLYAAGEALDYEVVTDDGERFDMDVRRCAYAEMMERLGARDVGHLLICNFDFPLARRAGLELTRTQTRMQGADFCDFRYRKRS